MLLASALREEVHVEPTETKWPEEPYKGLNFFSKDDAPLFGQRDTDTSSCAAVVGSVTSKVLLLHGRSGTGKSSFLRAGLLPRLEQARFWSLGTPATKGQPLIVRSTGSPLAKMHEALLMHLGHDNELAFLAEENRLQAVELLKAGVSKSGIDLADLLLDALSTISHGVTRQIVLTVDQSEELFTLCTDSAQRRAFFYFIEELCLRHLDVKLIVALRTEYYGQFCDQLRIDPNLRVSNSRTTLNQYMLHGLRSTKQIVAAIARPTLKEPLEHFGVPFDQYGFEFESGLAEHIAQDLVRHCGESSILPVMQIVCRDLYHAVVLKDNQRQISLAHYTRLGGVEGRVNAFIESAIRQALTNVRGYAPASSEIAKWQEVLAELVARQEGGVLATLLVDEATLVEAAKRHGIHDHVSASLKAMADEKCGLLRVATRTDPVTRDVHRQYSLGHDSLAPALFLWREARTDLLRERKKVRRARYALLAAVLVSGVLIGLFAYQRYMVSSQLVERYSLIVNGDSTPFFRTKILLSVASLEASQNIFVKELHNAEVGNLKQLLGRVPTIVSGPALAVGFGSSDFEIIHLDSDGKVFVRDLRKPDEVHMVGQIDVAAPSGFSQPAVGAVANLKRPVISLGGETILVGRRCSRRVEAQRGRRPRNCQGLRSDRMDFGGICGGTNSRDAISV